MKVLITSGGTKIRIDMVRSITNMSKGTFAAKIADEFLKESENENHTVDFIMAKESRFPKYMPEFIKQYETFNDYQNVLFKQIDIVKPDIIILAAAVSDYGVENFVDGKIRTTDELVIRLKPLPKLISMVRDAAPKATICGFKLLVNSTQEELDQACIDSLKNNRLNLVVGNDLRDIKAGNHKLTICSYTSIHHDSIEITRYESVDYNLAQVVKVSCIAQRGLR